MRKKFSWFLCFLFSLSILLVNAAVVAAEDKYGLNEAATKADLPSTVAGGDSMLAVLSKAIAAGLTLIGILFFLLILYAGANWMIARGDSERVNQAKDTMERAVVGLIIVVGSYALSKFVFEVLLKK